jgi:excisionase family DNA binding protein
MNRQADLHDGSESNWGTQISRHLSPGGDAVVPPRIAAWLEEKAGVSSDRRILLRETDPEAYSVLAALHIAALVHRSAIGMESPIRQISSGELATWLTTGDVSNRLGVTDRAIRKRIASGRLPATKFGGRWLLNRNDVRIDQALD